MVQMQSRLTFEKSLFKDSFVRFSLSVLSGGSVVLLIVGSR